MNKTIFVNELEYLQIRSGKITAILVPPGFRFTIGSWLHFFQSKDDGKIDHIGIMIKGISPINFSNGGFQVLTNAENGYIDLAVYKALGYTRRELHMKFNLGEWSGQIVFF